MEEREQYTMPQESINYPDPTEEAEISIHWSKQGAGSTVQIGMAIPTKLLREYLDDVTADSPGDHHVFWYTPTLTRDELNKLIRTARRARTAVYGADE